MERIALKDGLTIYGVSAAETAVLHREIVEERTYERHGIEVNDGDCVFDVGANIGLFSVHLGRTRKNLRLFAFEPIPALHEILARNAAEHLGGHAVTLLRCGLSDRAGTAKFELDPSASFTATMAPGAVKASIRRDAGAQSWALALLRDGQRAGRISEAAVRRGERALARRLTRPFALGAFLAWLAYVEARRALRKKRVECPLRTLHEVIEAERVERIDLLKVDVEGAEESVLAGCAAADWERVRQLVVEVHDGGGRLQRLEASLAARGFRVAVDREDWDVHELLGIQTLYATRA